VVGQALGGGGWFYREGLGQSVNHDVQCVYVHFPVYPFQWQSIFTEPTCINYM